MNMKRVITPVLALGIALGLNPAVAQAAPADTLNYYITVDGACNDANSGLSASQGLCTLKAASDKAEQAYSKGGARGDINVLYESGKTYTKKIGSTAGVDMWRFAPVAGKAVTITSTGAEKPIIKGNPQAKEAENARGLTIQPTKNRGGTFVVNNLEFRNLSDGVLINGGVNQTDVNGLNTLDNGVIMGTNAPIQNARITNNNFINMGTKYAPGRLVVKGVPKELNYMGNGALRFWNTDNLLISGNNFTNFYQKKHSNLSHVMYGYYSSNAKVENNNFRNTNSTVVHGRMGGNWSVARNVFRNTSSAEISTWYRGVGYSKASNPEYDRNMECRVNEPTTDGTNKYTFGFQRSIHGVMQARWCTSPERIYAPTSVTYTSLTDGIKVDFSGATTNGGSKVVSHEVYATHAGKNPVKLGTVKGANGTFTVKNDALLKAGFKNKEEVTLFVSAVSDKGDKTGSTSNQFWFRVGEGFSTAKFGNPDLKWKGETKTSTRSSGSSWGSFF